MDKICYELENYVLEAGLERWRQNRLRQNRLRQNRQKPLIISMVLYMTDKIVVMEIDKYE